ncbi:MAG: hypothetical protein HRU16_00270 [Planctomycetes bacterium]|nr:hypothetical protein [Planctomycetota bacterium]
MSWTEPPFLTAALALALVIHLIPIRNRSLLPLKWVSRIDKLRQKNR